MRAKLLVNDIHLGVQRSGGTTLKSASELRQYLLAKFRGLLLEHVDKDVIINGDLFDTFAVPMVDLLAFYEVAVEWLLASEQDDTHDTGEREPRLILGRGNHDWSKDSSKLSSFDFVARILTAQFPGRVAVVCEPKMVDTGIYMIPHMPNQDLFDLELQRAEGLENCLILLHANYDSGYVVESDHSLNVSREQAGRLIEKGNRLVFGHEHIARNALAMGGTLDGSITDWGVIITGNQWPTSIADCLNNPGGRKHAHLIEFNPTAEEHDLTPIETWNMVQGFAEIPWDRLSDWAMADTVNFIRVTGTATAEQAPGVIEAVSKFRNHSGAFVVTNAVKIEGVNDMQDLQVSAEEVKSFDVLAYLYENLDDEQARVVKGLLAKADPLKEAA